ncbi:MAG TPA: DUF3048 domain-containing protein [Lachnospiraceae bacterium]|nr:DUF3048 domain-containing protein [Lachnospiraceae bacterium]
MKRKTLFRVLSLSVVFSLALAGCKKDKDKDKEQESAFADPVIQVVTEDKEKVEPEAVVEEVVVEEETREGMYRSELTNEWIDEAIKDQRPIAAMVDNEKTALPHYGLTKADIVYEMTNSTANEGVTRFMVLVKDWESITQLGSIRSVRPTNLQIIPEWNAVICHDGGPFYIDDYLAKDYVENFSGTFSRVDNGKSREFTEYICTGDLDKNFTSKGYSRTYNDYYPGPHYQFASESSPVDLSSDSKSIDATHIQLPYRHNKPYLDYDESTGLYYYSEYGQKHTDPGNNNEQLSFKNILLQDARYVQFDSNGYMMFHSIDFNRDGYYITNGKAIPITWSKEDELTPTRYYDLNGDMITLNTGMTYVALIPDDIWSSLEIK